MKKLFQQVMPLISLVACSTSVHASVISTWANNPIYIYRDSSNDPLGYIGGSTSYALDLNADEIDDINFISDIGGVGFFISEGTRILGYNYGRSGDLFASSHLNKGDVIGASGQIWDTGGYHLVATMIVPMSDQFIPSYPNYPNQYYIGLEITVDNQPHYGWLSIQAPDNPGNSAIVSGWAYEDVPDTPLAAGAIPEPSSIVLIGIGTLGVWMIRQKKNR